MSDPRPEPHEPDESRENEAPDTPRKSEPNEDADTPPPQQDEHIPLEPSARPGSAPPAPHGDKLKGAIDRPSLMEGGADEDVCPSCGKPLPSPSAVVCTNCGFDLVANRQRDTQVGDVEVDEYDAERYALVRSKPLGPVIPSVVGLLGILLGAVFAGVFADRHEVRAVLRVLLYAPLLAGLGVGAVALAAALLEKKTGRIDVATGRMLGCVGLTAAGFFLCQGIETHPAIQFIIGGGLGLLLYLGFAKFTFRLPRNDLLMLLGLHFLMWLFFQLLLIAIKWLENPPPAPSAPVIPSG